MTHPAAAPRMPAAEYLAWEEKQVSKHEFLAGEVFAMVGVTRQHAAAGNVFTFLVNNLRATRCRSYMADMKVRVEAADAFFYPDVFVTCSEADHQAEHFMSEPRLIVEVLSDSTEAYDRGVKFEKYRQISSLMEYVSIDPVRRKIELFRRNVAGHWVLFEFRSEDAVAFESLGLSVEGATIFADV